MPPSLFLLLFHCPLPLSLYLSCLLRPPPQHLRQIGIVGRFIEFFGSGVAQLSIADQATISIMCPECSTNVGYLMWMRELVADW